METAIRSLRPSKSVIALLLIALGLGLSPASMAPATARQRRMPSSPCPSTLAMGRLSVTDKRTGQRWRQQATAQGKLDGLVAEPRGIKATWQDSRTGLDVQVSVQVDQAKPEFTVTLSAQGNLKRSLRYLHPFVTEPGTYLVVPMNEGISYPVEDATVETRKLIAYGGHGICMPFWGVTDGQRGLHGDHRDAGRCVDLASPASTASCASRPNGSRRGANSATRAGCATCSSTAAATWPCASAIAPTRKRPACSRRWTRSARRIPNVDLLIGAVNVWCWEKDALAIVQEMQATGIDRILWSNRQGPEGIRAMNEMPAS